MLMRSFDERRDLAIGQTTEEATRYAADLWIDSAKRAIQTRKRFAVALSGGSTPNAIYRLLPGKSLDWSKVFLFWSDERAVPPSHPDSNFHAAMQSGLRELPIRESQIFRMPAEKKPIEQAAAEYEALLQPYLPFDLVMLGVGEDGHTASLFPNTSALLEENHLVSANWVPQKNCWRMTLTFSGIHSSEAIIVYALGASKETIVPEVLRTNAYPASHIGKRGLKALWLLDNAAAKQLL